MGNPTSGTTKTPEPHRHSEAGPRGSPTAATDVADAAHSDEYPSRIRWFSEVAPTGVLTGVLGEMAFYYEVCCLHHHSAQRRGRTR
jgi:hypothetical protein